MNRCLLAAILVLASAGTLAAQPAVPPVAPEGVIERDTVEISPHPHVRIRSIQVDNRLGDVTVVGHDGQTVSLTVVKRAPDGETLERLKVNLLPDPNGALRVGAALLFGDEARPIPAGSVRIDLTLSVPRHAHLDVKAWNGKVSARGLREGASLLANAADISVVDVHGPVSTSAARGVQTIESVTGAVTADNAYGDLSLDRIDGETLAARVHEGTVRATRVRSRKVTIRTTFGRILFQGELMAGARYDVRSYRGDVEVRFLGAPVVARGVALRIDAYARDGRVDSRLDMAEPTRPEAGRLMGTFGSSRGKPAVLQVSSTTGNVILGLVND